jgi:phage tail sheath protein FI
MSFFHGISILEQLAGGVGIQSINAAVIGLVGSAPTWAVSSSAIVQPPQPNKLFLVNNTPAAGAMGPLIQGYSIPYALSHILEQSGQNGVGQVICINVFNPAVHQTTVSGQTLTMPASGTQYVNLGHMGIVGPGLNGYTNATTLVFKNAGGNVTYIENTDYTVDYINGFVYAKSGGALSTGQGVQASYAYCDPSKVADADLIGAVTSGVYTGMQNFILSFSSFGFNPRILIAPGYNGYVGSKDQSVAAALVAVANQVRGIALADSSSSVTVSTALSNRSNATTSFGLASGRLGLTYPNLFFEDVGIIPTGNSLNSSGTVINTTVTTLVDGPMSAWAAGAWSASILANGFWVSPSNKPLNGPTGPDTNIYMSAFDPNSDTNNLNAAGIVTVNNNFGTGLLVWGNRAASFPSASDPTTFLAVRMALDVIEISIQQASLQFLDQPITVGLIRSVLASVNGFIRTMIQQGALLPGSQILYNPNDNPATQLSLGIVTFEVDVMPPPPAENIVYDFIIDSSLLNNIGPLVVAAASSSAL